MAKFNQDLLILVVGDITLWRASGRALPQIAHTKFCEFSDLDHTFLKNHQPDIILTPLVSIEFDIWDMAVVLDDQNYEGRVRAMTPPLPNPDIILGEIRFEFPALDFDIIEVRPGPYLRSV